MKKINTDIEDLIGDVVIIANGEYPSSSLPLSIIKESSVRICCDGATQTTINHGITPDYIIGDCDSITPKLRKKFADRILTVEEQEDNDLTKSFKFSLSKGYKRISIVAATGKREDHTLGNISLLMRYAKEASVRMITDNGIFIPCEGNMVISGKKGQQVSLFNFTCTHITSTGLLYPIYPFTQLWQGTLNEMTADTFEINADGQYLVYLVTE